MSFLEKCLFKSSSHCFGWDVFFLLSCVSWLYILKNKPLVFAWFSNIFSHSVGFLFCLWVPLLCKSLCLIKFHLSILLWFLLSEGNKFLSENVSPMFSSRNMIVSCLMFKFFKPFWVYFHAGCEGVFWLQGFTSSCSVSSTSSAEKTVFSSLYILVKI